MTDTLSFQPITAVSTNGTLVANAQATFFVTGTTTPVVVYSDAGLTTPHAVPLVADGNGFFAEVFYAGGAVKAVVSEPLGATLYTIDPVVKSATAGGAASDISFNPTTPIPKSNVQDAIEQVQTNLGGYLPLAGGTLTGSLLLGGKLDTNAQIIRESVGTAQASAATVTPPTNGNVFHITGIVAVTGFTNGQAGISYKVVADAALPLTNSATLVVEGGANKTLIAGDHFWITQDTPTIWRVWGFPPLAVVVPVVSSILAFGSVDGLTAPTVPTFNNETGMATITHISTGLYELTMDNAAANSFYIPQATALDETGLNRVFFYNQVASKTTTVFRIRAEDVSGIAINISFTFSVIGLAA